METITEWLSRHRWKTLAGVVAGLCLYLLAAELAPRAASAFSLYEAWQQHEARIASVKVPSPLL